MITLTQEMIQDYAFGCSEIARQAIQQCNGLAQAYEAGRITRKEFSEAMADLHEAVKNTVAVIEAKREQ